MARQYFVEIGEPQRRHFIGRQQSYHGNTLGALAVGGNEWRRKQFAPLLIETHHVSPCFEYRGKQPSETPRQYGERLAQELEAKIAELGPETVIAFVAETVVGATSGAVPPVEGYFKRIREICDRHGVLLILDEVMCGMGRTGTLHACEQEGIAPDLMAIAKGLGGGFAPIGAVLVGSKIFDALKQGSGLFQHGHTYLGHPLACAGALAVQQVIRRDDLLANVRRQGEHLTRRLGERFGNHHHVGDVRGRGLFQAVELVKDRASKETVRSPPQAARAHQAGGHGARADGLSHGRHHRRSRAAITCCWRRRSSSHLATSTPSSSAWARPSTPPFLAAAQFLAPGAPQKCDARHFREPADSCSSPLSIVAMGPD